MYRIGPYQIWTGDFHGQFQEQNNRLPLFLSAMSVCGYDFTLFNTGDTSPEGPLPTLVRKLGIPFYVLPYGRELFYEWSHLMVGGLKPDAVIPPLDDNNPERVLRALRPQCDFISLAHPYEAFVDHLDAILDAKLADAVAYRDQGHPENFCEWYRTRIADGKKTPIVAELDFHVTAGKRAGAISYQTCEEACKDLNPCGKKYTLVFADACTPEALYEAVRLGRSVVDLEDRLYGEPQWIRILEEGGYREMKYAERKRRESLHLVLDEGVTPMCGEEFTIHLQWDGRHQRDKIQVPASRTASEISRHELPWVVEDQCRCVTIAPPVACRLLPVFRNGKSEVEVRVTNHSQKKTFSGNLIFFAGDREASSPVQVPPLPPGMQKAFHFPLCPEVAFSDTPVSGRCLLSLEGLPPLECVRDLIFFRIAYSKTQQEDDWARADPAKLDRPELLDLTFLSGWEGPEECSAQIRFLWNEEALFLRADMTDAVLEASPREDAPYFGDCLQIAFNPLDDPKVSPFSFYHWIATRGGFQGRKKEFCELWNVPDDPLEGQHKPKFRLPDCCYRLQRNDEKHLSLFLTFPWSLLPLIPPRAGSRFQTHMILWDKDAGGIKCGLHWPRRGVWYQPSDETWASVELIRQ